MVVDIVKKAGVAKGTFFYYFPTKEAVLEAIYIRWANEVAASFHLRSRQLTAVNKLQAFILQLLAPTQIDILIDKLWNEEQFNLLYKTWQQTIEGIFNSPLSDIIKQGNHEGTMHVNCINETIAFFWSTLECLWNAAYFKEPPEVLLTKTKIAESVMERILGIEEGVFKLSIPQN